MNLSRIISGIGRGLAVVVILASPLPGVAQGAPVAHFSFKDVFELRSVGDVRISPDGRTIAYEALDTDIMIDGRRRSVRLIDVASGQDRLLADGAGSPRWSPDSRSLAFHDTKGGANRLMLSDAAARTPRLVTTLPGTPSPVSWSPDGTKLAFSLFVPAPVVSGAAAARPEGARWAPPLRVVTTIRHDEDGQSSNTPGHTQLFVMNLAGGTPRQVTSAPLDVAGDPAWLPNGRALVYSAINLDAFGPGFRSGRLYLVPATGGTPVALTSTDLAAQAPAVSPDGRRIAFISWDVDGRDFSPIRLRLMDARGGASRVIERALDRDFSSVSWSGDGRHLYAGYADRSVDKVRRIAIDGSESRDVGAAIDGDFTVSTAGAIAYAAARSDRPADIALLREGAATATRLTRRNEALLGDKVLATTVPLAVRSSLDGASVGAWLTRPPGYVAGRRYPLILDIHGGPYGYDGPVWRTRDQLYAAAGYLVLHVNYRGSTSYGFAFADRIAGEPLAPSYADLMSAVDAVVAAGVADRDRLFVTGGSAGGELTAWIVGHTTRFRAAMAEKPIINDVSYALTSDQYYTATIIDRPLPWQNAATRWALSPLSAVAKVVTPTMLIVGEDDRRTPATEALQFYHALKLRGVPTALVLVPEASHSSIGTRPSHLNEMLRLTIDWFERHAPSQ